MFVHAGKQDTFDLQQTLSVKALDKQGVMLAHQEKTTETRNQPWKTILLLWNVVWPGPGGYMLQFLCMAINMATWCLDIYLNTKLTLASVNTTEDMIRLHWHIHPRSGKTHEAQSTQSMHKHAK
jgi:hypothetical protein